MLDDPGMLWRALSVVGFLCLVGAYLANQRGMTRADATGYLAANTIGSGLLAIYSAVIDEWVFVALECFWFVASAIALRGAWKRGRA